MGPAGGEEIPLVVLLIVVAIIAIVAMLLLATSASAKTKLLKVLRSQVSGSLVQAPPAVVGSGATTLRYTFSLGTSPIATAITPASQFHQYFSVQVTFRLVAAGGATFIDGSRSFSIPMTQNGHADTAITAVARGSDQLVITYVITEVGSGKAVMVPDPTPYDFETVYP